MYAHTPVVATQHLSGLTRETTIGKKNVHIMFLFTKFCMILLINVLNCKPDDPRGSNVLLPLFDKENNQTMDGKLY